MFLEASTFGHDQLMSSSNKPINLIKNVIVILNCILNYLTRSWFYQHVFPRLLLNIQYTVCRCLHWNAEDCNFHPKWRGIRHRTSSTFISSRVHVYVTYCECVIVWASHLVLTDNGMAPPADRFGFLLKHEPRTRTKHRPLCNPPVSYLNRF